ncbi:competence protein ComK [Caldifermentibacillus hisashii]|uniref:competence protein ComK n=1 Tax=Caldifermentibacillus hisashii TaxID=996558 RepID=UPI002E0B4134|nr:competence protein ComK [Caldifermentibacillus hisashii]MEC5271730.1 competence protein ComK [Caldifermentibacillus hisashii]
MKQIHPHYPIHRNTMALLPANQIDYHSIAIETNKQLYVRQTPLEIMKQACLERFTTYDGIRKAVYKRMKFKRKVPIPINPFVNIYFFPTHAMDDYNCHWISYYHVLRVINNKNPQANNPSSTILFKNGQHLDIDVSSYILRKQMRRTREYVDRYLHGMSTV